MENEHAPKKLYRSDIDKLIAGVCGGLGIYFKIDPIIFRLIFLILALSGGSGFILYVLCVIFIPRDNKKLK